MKVGLGSPDTTTLKIELLKEFFAMMRDAAIAVAEAENGQDAVILVCRSNSQTNRLAEILGGMTAHGIVGQKVKIGDGTNT